MLNIAINIGSYSVKFLNFQIDRKKVTYLSSKEVLLDSDEYNIQEENIVLDLQMKMIHQYLDEIDEDYRAILNASNEMITERFLDLPVKNKKKAQLMLPFQLEEDIPFSLAECQLASSIEQTPTGSKAIINIIKHELLRPFFAKINEYKIQPKILTSEISAIELYIRKTTEILPQSFCILDIGHSTTHAYFFMDGQLKSTHTSYIAGFTINEEISKNYNISLEEAAIYKHQNCYFLSSEQYAQVNENQKVFATMMDGVFSPLINEFKRWHIGFRVQNGIAANEVFVLGGSSNIKNITNYLTEKIGIKVGMLQLFKDCNSDKVDTDEKQRRKFAITHMLASGYNHKSDLVNFLTGEYAVKGQADLPLHSFAFTAVRVSILTIVLVLSLSIERIFTSRDIKVADKKLKALVKNPILKISPRNKRNVTKKPSAVLTKLKRETKSINQEVKSLQSSVETNALKPLEMISNMVAGLDTEIIQYQSVSHGDFVIVFKTKDKNTITKLDAIFKSSNIKNLYTDKSMANKTYTINGSEQ
jgi:Tfp pilus assembly PilM family ATPase